MASSIENKIKIVKMYKNILNNIPNQFKLIDFFIPGYENECHGVFTLSDSDLKCSEQYNDMIEQVKSAVGSEFIPLVRLSDGEFNLLLGDRWPGNWWTLRFRIRKIIGFIRRRVSSQVSFSNASYSGDNFVSKDVATILRSRAIESIFYILERGFLAPHLSLTHRPFQADYIVSFLQLVSPRLRIDWKPMIPFYFVYPFLLSSRGDFLFEGRRVLIVHSAEGKKKNRIISALKKRGVVKVLWESIPHSWTFDADLDLTGYAGNVDVAFVGAGISKLLLIDRFECLNVPVIDAGFVFEVWNDPNQGLFRPFCGLAEEGII